LEPLAAFTTTFAVVVAMEVVQLADAALEVANVVMRTAAARATAAEHVAATLPGYSVTWAAFADCVATKAVRVVAELAAKPAPLAGNKAGSITARTCNRAYLVIMRAPPCRVEATVNTGKADYRPPKLDILTTPFVDPAIS